MPTEPTSFTGVTQCQPTLSGGLATLSGGVSTLSGGVPTQSGGVSPRYQEVCPRYREEWPRYREALLTRSPADDDTHNQRDQDTYSSQPLVRQCVHVLDALTGKQCILYIYLQQQQQ